MTGSVKEALRADRRLYVTADRDAVVEEADPRGRFLLYAAGRPIGAGDAERYELEADEYGRVTYPGCPELGEPEVEAEVEVEAGELPDDVPGRRALIAAGITTLEALEAVGDFTDVSGIGDATAEELAAYLGARDSGAPGES